MLNYSMGVGDF